MYYRTFRHLPINSCASGCAAAQTLRYIRRLSVRSSSVLEQYAKDKPCGFEPKCQILLDAYKGRYLQATRALSPGETVLREAPAVIAFEDASRCFVCSQVHSLTRCPRRPELPAAALHALATGSAEAKLIGQFAVLLLLLQPSSSSISPNGDDRNGTAAAALQLPQLSLLAELQAAFDPRRNAADVAGVLQLLAQCGVPANPPHLVHRVSQLHEVVRTNSIQGSPNGVETVGVYPLTAMLEHSCRPNCHTTVADDGELTLTASTHIDAGSPLSISYIPHDLYRPHRHRQQLLDHWGFVCRCEVCSERRDIFRAFHCLHRGCNGVVCPPLSPPSAASSGIGVSVAASAAPAAAGAPAVHSTPLDRQRQQQAEGGSSWWLCDSCGAAADEAHLRQMLLDEQRAESAADASPDVGAALLSNNSTLAERHHLIFHQAFRQASAADFTRSAHERQRFERAVRLCVDALRSQRLEGPTLQSLLDGLALLQRFEQQQRQRQKQ